MFKTIWQQEQPTCSKANINIVFSCFLDLSSPCVSYYQSYVLRSCNFLDWLANKVLFVFIQWTDLVTLTTVSKAWFSSTAWKGSREPLLKRKRNVYSNRLVRWCDMVQICVSRLRRCCWKSEQIAAINLSKSNLYWSSAIK